MGIAFARLIRQKCQELVPLCMTLGTIIFNIVIQLRSRIYFDFKK